MKKKFLLLFCLFFGFAYTQENERLITTQEIDKTLSLAEKNYNVDIEIAQKLFLKTHNASKLIGYDEGILKSNKYLMAISNNKGEEKKAIEYANEMEKIAKDTDDNEYLTRAYIQKSISFSGLDLFDDSYKELLKAKDVIKKYPVKDKQHYDLSYVYQNLVSSYYEPTNAPQDTILTYLKKSLWEAEQIDDSSKDVHPDDKYDMISYLNMNIGMFYAGVHKPQRLDLAEQYLQRSLSTINKRKFTKIKINKIPILNALGRFYVEYNKYDRAIDHANEVIELEKKQKSPDERMVAYMILTNSYEGLKKKDSIIKYMSLYTNLTDSLAHLKRMNADSLIKKVNSEKEKKHRDNIEMILVITFAIVVALSLLGWFFWRINQNKLHKKYQAIIQSLAQSKTIDPLCDENKISLKNSPEKGTIITDQTTQLLLERLQKFEQSKKFIKKEVSRVYLANSLHTNTKYLSEIIRQRTGKNFNNYINGLRIQYITELLYNDPKYREYKISYLAEVSGFASREVFAVIFKKETGITPSYFISQLKTDEGEAEL